VARRELPGCGKCQTERNRQARQGDAAIVGPISIESHQPARRVRIAVTVFLGTLTATFIALWVRSQFGSDTIQTPGRPSYFLSSAAGYLMVGRSDDGTEAALIHYVFSETSGGYPPITGNTIGTTKYLSVPYWILISVAGAACYTSYWRFGYSLRTMLVVATLVIFAIGLFSWIIRR
jgi:hypothetical protein